MKSTEQRLLARIADCDLEDCDQCPLDKEAAQAIKDLREAIATHRRTVWGTGKPKHDADRRLYAVREGT